MANKKQSQSEIFDNVREIKFYRQQWQGHEPDKETNTEPSQTIPGMDMSISEMLSRTQRGLPISSGAVPVYNGERLLPNWKHLDLIDRQKVIQEAKSQVEELKTKMHKQKKSIERKRIEFEAVQKALQEKQQSSNTVTNGQNNQS